MTNPIAIIDDAVWQPLLRLCKLVKWQSPTAPASHMGGLPTEFLTKMLNDIIDKINRRDTEGVIIQS